MENNSALNNSSSMNLELVNSIKSLGLVLVDEDYLRKLHFDVAAATSKDPKRTYLSRKEVKEKYNRTRYWLDAAEMDPRSKLKFRAGKGVTSKKEYLEQSVIDEMKRQSI